MVTFSEPLVSIVGGFPLRNFIWFDQFQGDLFEMFSFGENRTVQGMLLCLRLLISLAFDSIYSDYPSGINTEELQGGSGEEWWYVWERGGRE